MYNVYTYTYGNQHEIYLRVISSNEGLLHSDPQCDGNEELLVRFLELIRRGREQLNTWQLLWWICLSLFLSVPK